MRLHVLPDLAISIKCWHRIDSTWKWHRADTRQLWICVHGLSQGTIYGFSGLIYSSSTEPFSAQARPKQALHVTSSYLFTMDFMSTQWVG